MARRLDSPVQSRSLRARSCVPWAGPTQCNRIAGAGQLIWRPAWGLALESFPLFTTNAMGKPNANMWIKSAGTNGIADIVSGIANALRGRTTKPMKRNRTRPIKGPEAQARRSTRGTRHATMA